MDVGKGGEGVVKCWSRARRRDESGVGSRRPAGVTPGFDGKHATSSTSFHRRRCLIVVVAIAF